MRNTFTPKTLLLLITVWAGCLNILCAQQSGNPTGNNQPAKEHHYTYKVVSGTNNTFGYDLYDKGTLVVHQTTIPGKSGWNGFASEQEASNAALVAIAEKNNPKVLPANPSADSPNSK